MTDEIEEQDNINKLWHRKQCSNRVFIGPWDIKAPPPPPPPLDSIEREPEHLPIDNSSIQSDSSTRLLNQ
jgi:hypothetical protein